MDLSYEMPNFYNQFEEIKRRKNEFIRSPLNHTRNHYDISFHPNDVIDVDKIIFTDDEVWLYESPKKSTITNLNEWLYKNSNDIISDDNCDELKDEIRNKNIDTRTFTRPKKRFLRPSIEKYNEELYGNVEEVGSVSSSIKNQLGPLKFKQEEAKETTKPLQLYGNVEKVVTIPTSTKRQSNQLKSQEGVKEINNKPLNFDLTQPTTSYYFENILNNSSSNADSFQNMSPPSLVNSMCSSTFANLMESSFIKNDPVLKEICDTDYTGSVLLQDVEAPILQSFTESCSSINSDTVAEQFLKKLSMNNETFTKSMEFDNINDYSSASTVCLEQNNSSKESLENSLMVNELNENNQTKDNLNGTYQRSARLKSTFNMADVKSGSIKLKTNYEKNLTQNDSSDLDSLSIEENQKNDQNCTYQLVDINKLSYRVKNEEDKMNLTRTVQDSNKKRNSLNLESTHLIVNENPNNDLLKKSKIDAIVEMQERSLQLMSTPIPNTRLQNKVLENNLISPISLVNECYSDSSSNDECKNLNSTIIKQQPIIINSNTIKKQKSLGNIGPNSTFSRKFLKGSYVNLKESTETNLGRSQPNLHKISSKDTKTNLNTMGRTLKGSYTSLKPISANLPVAPPVIGARSLNNTTTLIKSSQNARSSNVAEIVPMPRENSKQTPGFVKPRPPTRSSGLPRPVSMTGIPRPLSKIPGPRNFR